MAKTKRWLFVDQRRAIGIVAHVSHEIERVAAYDHHDRVGHRDRVDLTKLYFLLFSRVISQKQRRRRFRVYGQKGCRPFYGGAAIS